MVKEESIRIGNKFIGEINKKIFTIIGFKNDNGIKFILLESEGNKIYIEYNMFKHLLLKEV